MEKEREIIEFYLLESKSFIFLMVSYTGTLSTTLYGRDNNIEVIR
jgi:hypothetical protein